MPDTTTTDTTPTDAPDPPQREEEIVELKRIRRALDLMGLMAAVIACYFARDVILPLILGVILSLTLSPVIRALSRRGVPAPFSAITLIVFLGLGIGAAGYAVSGPVSAWLQELPALGTQIQTRLDGIFGAVEEVQEATAQVEEITQGGGGGDTGTAVQMVQIDQPGFMSSALSGAATTVTTVLVALVLALFLLASGEMFTVKLVETLPRLSEKKRALKIVHGVEKAISRYLLTITVINAGLGLVVFGLMWAIGLPNAYIWGFIAFAFNFLPFIGAAVGVVLVGAYAILTFDSLGYAVLAPALYMAATSLEGNIITPTILGRRLEMNVVSVFVTVVFWGWLWGIAGALLAVPFLVIVKVVCDHIPNMQKFGNFLGSSSIRVNVEPDPEPEKSGAETT